MQNVVVRFMLVAAVLAALSGCGANPSQEIASAETASFRMVLLPDSLVGGAKIASSRLSIAPTNDGVEVTISVFGAQALQALYVKLYYDSQRFTPASARATGVLGRCDNLLELSRLDQPGVVTHGQVLRDWDKLPGFCGAGQLVVVCFKQQPFSPPIAARSASAAPGGNASRTVLSLDAGTERLSWRYYNHGDYDQNGVVSIADLTPLGMHFGEAGPFDIDTSLGVIDGNGDGQIGLGDLVAIGANFDRRTRGYRVYESLAAGDYPPSNTADSVPGWHGEVNAAAGNPAVERLSYSYELPAILADAYYWVRPYDGAPLDPAASEGTPSNLLDSGALLNEAPVADLIAHPALGLAPLPVQFYAGGSADPDGTIVQYEWDFDGDGTYDEAGYQEFTQHVYDTPGMYIVSLRVTDNHGGTGVDGNLIVVNQPEGWRLSLPMRDTYLDNGFAVAIVDGRPAVVYSSYNELRYSQASDPAAVAWASAVAITANPAGEGSASLAELGGRPAVAFAAADGQGPYFVQAADAAGTAWPAPRAIVMPTLGGLFRTRMIVAGNGRPLVGASILGAGDNSIQVVLATDNTGLLWELPAEADGGAAGFLTPSLALVDVLPAMAYMNADNAAVYSPSSGVPDGSDWVDETVIDPMIFSESLCLAEVNGRPAIAYINDPTHLHYIRADDVAGTSWLNVTQPDAGTSLRFDTAMANNAGVPVIAYVAVANGGTGDELRFIRALDEDGAGWEAPQVIGEFDRVGQIVMLELSDGRPALMFQVQYDVLDPGLIGDALYFAVPE